MHVLCIYRASDENEDNCNDSDLSINEYPKQQQPSRSYRCTTNMADLEQFNKKLQLDCSDMDGESEPSAFMLRSLFIFSDSNPIRRVCKALTGKKYPFKNNQDQSRGGSRGTKLLRKRVKSKLSFYKH